MDEELLSRNKNINRGFRKLEVWKEAIELYVFITKKIRALNAVPFKVRAQTEDSIFSVHSNIAEGYSRRSLKENIQFVNIALASLAENYSQILALYTFGDIVREWFDEYDKKHYSLENKLIQFNKTMIAKLDKNEWKNDYIIRELIEKYEP
jgi:four helix bundle protein